MYNFRVKRRTEVPADSVFSGPITRLLSMLRVLMKIFSQARAKKKTEGFKVLNFALLLVVFKRHHANERVKHHVYLLAARSPAEQLARRGEAQPSSDNDPMPP